MTVHRAVSRRLRWLVAIVLLPMVYLWGFATVAYQFPPFGLLVALSERRASSATAQLRGEEQLLRFAFTDPVANGGSYFAPVKSLADLRARNEQIRVQRSEFDRAYEEIDVGEVEQLTDGSGRQIVKLAFRLFDNDYEAFAYGARPSDCQSGRASMMLIPGSGLNQSSAIVDRDSRNYHAGLLPMLDKFSVDTYVFIKPNEDFLAWSDGSGRKVNYDLIFNWHLNREGSYPASYLVQALAVQKFLNACYGTTAIAGLSQGGFAALLVGLQARPTLVVVASGFSVLSRDTEWAAPNQIVGLPRQSEYYNPVVIRDLLGKSPSRWLFTVGEREEGFFQIEAAEMPTDEAIGSLPNVELIVHSGGHSFPPDEIAEFLRRSKFETRK